MALYRSFIAKSRLFLLLALTLYVTFVRTETVAVASPTLQSDNQGTQSGDDGTDIVYEITTKYPSPDMTQNSFTHSFDYEDNKESVTVDEEGVLGPGAITAIVIAVFLGVSVLLALVVITLRKFTAS